MWIILSLYATPPWMQNGTWLLQFFHYAFNTRRPLFFFAYCEEWMVSWLLCFFFVPLLLYIMVECCRTLSLKVAFRPLIWLHCFAENNLAELLLCHVKWSVIHVPGIFVNAIWNGQSKFSILDYCKVDPFSNQQSPVKYRRGLIMLPRNANNILT